jgi:flagellar P-ring protein precursor FlgI
MWAGIGKSKASKAPKMYGSSSYFCSAHMLAMLLLFSPNALASEPGTPRQARVKDISSIEGIRDNQLVGYGIVVGLQGTGDSQQTTFPIQTLAATLLRMGVSVPASSIRVQNLAAVFVSATLPPFARSGTKLDITVSSAGDARSLEGGLLLMTPLYGADGNIYAQAQGSLVVGGYSVTANGNVKQFNHPNTARVPFGAMVERGVSLELGGKSQFSLLLNDADFRSAEAMALAINRTLGRSAARVLDSRRVELSVASGSFLERRSSSMSVRERSLLGGQLSYSPYLSCMGGWRLTW